MFETFLFLYDVLWLESTTLLFGGAPLMSLLDMKFLFLASHILTNLWRLLCYGLGLSVFGFHEQWPECCYLAFVTLA